ncbi:hypothetical protein QTP88_008479 [Uroleucon formosanum]
MRDTHHLPYLMMCFTVGKSTLNHVVAVCDQIDKEHNITIVDYGYSFGYNNRCPDVIINRHIIFRLISFILRITTLEAVIFSRLHRSKNVSNLVFNSLASDLDS